MTGAQTGALALALAVPLLAPVVATRAGRPGRRSRPGGSDGASRPGRRSRPGGSDRAGRPGRRSRPGGSDGASRPGRWRGPDRGAQLVVVVAAGAWLFLVASGANGGGVGFHVTPLVAAAGCGAALLTIAALDGLTSQRSVAATSVALAAVGVGLAAGEGGVQAFAVVAGLAAAAVLTIGVFPPADGRRMTGLLTAAGVAACAAAFVVVHDSDGRWSVPSGGVQSLGAITAFLAAAALLCAAGSLGRRRPPAVLAAGGLAVALSVAPLRAGADELGAVVVVLAAAAVVAAGARHGTLSLALLALAAAAGPATLTPSSRLFAAAAVVALAVDAPWAWLAAVPGAAGLALGVIDDGSRLAVAVAVAAAVVAFLLAQAVAERASGGRALTPGRHEGDSVPDAGPALPVGVWPAVIVGAWLLVAPGTWTWTGSDLDVYDQGTARAVAAGLVVVVARVLVGRRKGLKPTEPPPAPPPGELSLTPAALGHPPRQLVRSKRSASTPRPRRAFRSQRSRPRGRSSAHAQDGTRQPRTRRSRRSRRRAEGPPSNPPSTEGA